MNRSALRYAARQFTCYFLLAIAALYVWVGVQTTSTLNYLVWAGCFLAFAGGTFAWRYRDAVERLQERAERAQFDATMAAQRAEHTASMERLSADLRAQQLEREECIAAEVQAGERCPVDCEGCAEDRREIDRRNAEYRRATAKRHATPSAA